MLLVMFSAVRCSTTYIWSTFPRYSLGGHLEGPSFELIIVTSLQTHSVPLPWCACPRVPGYLPWGGVDTGPN